MKNKRIFIWMIFVAGLAVINCSDVNSDEVPDCNRSFCGCWEYVTLEFNTTILNEENQPLTNIEVYCAGEETPQAVSDPSGAAGFKIATQYSPGCHYALCSNLVFKDKNQISSLTEIALHQDSGAFKDAPRFPNYITTENDILTAISYGSRTLKKYGPDLRSGDMSLLEDIATKRS